MRPHSSDVGELESSECDIELTNIVRSLALHLRSFSAVKVDAKNDISGDCPFFTDSKTFLTSIVVLMGEFV